MVGGMIVLKGAVAAATMIWPSIQGELMVRTKQVWCFSLGLLLLGSSVSAQDLIGDWQAVPGKSYGAISGQPVHHPTRPAGDHHIAMDSAETALPWLLKITDQQGNSLHGQWCSPSKCEPLIGVIRRDGSIVMVDEDSTFFATRYGDEMELIVTEPGEDLRVAVSHTMQKK
jgi:hypothetical protein